MQLFGLQGFSALHWGLYNRSQDSVVSSFVQPPSETSPENCSRLLIGWPECDVSMGNMERVPMELTIVPPHGSPSCTLYAFLFPLVLVFPVCAAFYSV